MPDESSIYGTNTNGEAILRTSENAEGDPTSIYGVNSDGKACMRVSSDVTSDDPTSIYGVNGSGEACVRIEGSGGGGSAVIESLNVTPTTSAQTIRPDSGVDGFSPVNVSAVDSGIDANIVAENIKKDVTILGVKGSYEGGGGSSTQYGINLKGWCGDIDANTGRRRTDQAVGTLSMPTLTNVLPYEFYEKFLGSSGVVGVVDLSGVVYVGDESFGQCFKDTNITGVNLGHLTSVGFQSFHEAFRNTKITEITFESETVMEQSFYGACWGCSLLRNVYIRIPGYAFNDFATERDWDLVYDVISSAIGDLIHGCTNCTVHFYKNIWQDWNQWYEDRGETSPFETEQDWINYMLNMLEGDGDIGNSVVFDIDPA